MMLNIHSYSAATKLTDRMLGHSTEDMVSILRQIAKEYGISHIAYVNLGDLTSTDTGASIAVDTYPRRWHLRYALKRYIRRDPIIERGRQSILPFDWNDVLDENPESAEFFADAFRHGVGRSGFSIPIRNRRKSCSLVSISSQAAGVAWEEFKETNMVGLQHLAALIDSSVMATSRFPPPQVQLSRREEQCLIWAARGKTHQEIAEILLLSSTSVRSHLDTARHKLHCINLTHAVGVAIATGVVPAAALRERDSL